MEPTKQNCFVQIRDKRKWEQTVDFLHEIGIKPYPEKDHPNFNTRFTCIGITR